MYRTFCGAGREVHEKIYSRAFGSRKHTRSSHMHPIKREAVQKPKKFLFGDLKYGDPAVLLFMSR